MKNWLPVGVGSGVGHGQLAGAIEVQIGIDLSSKGMPGSPCLCLWGRHPGPELGDHAMEGCAVVIALVVLLSCG